jgi:predicted AAA+ superfamily ATPase
LGLCSRKKEQLVNEFKKIGRGKAIMIIGLRQVGKTTLMRKHLAGLDDKRPEMGI